MVLWVAMGLRNSIMAIVGIPFSFGFALICMNLLGVSIKVMMAGKLQDLLINASEVVSEIKVNDLKSRLDNEQSRKSER